MEVKRYIYATYVFSLLVILTFADDNPFFGDLAFFLKRSSVSLMLDTPVPTGCVIVLNKTISPFIFIAKHELQLY